MTSLVNSDYSDTLIIIPTYNEAKNVEKMTAALFQNYIDINVLIVDDNSPDGTSDIVRGLMKNYSGLNLLKRECKSGLASAYIDGFKWGLLRKYDYFVQIDCDFSHDPKEIEHFRDMAKSYDLVVGSRYINGVRVLNWPFKRLFLSYLASLYIRSLTRIPLVDPTEGFKCFTRKTLEKLDLDNIISKGYIFQFEINFKVWSYGMRIKECPITLLERTKGDSKMNFRIVLEAFCNVIWLLLLKKIKKL